MSPFNNSSSSLALKRSRKPFSHGLPGAMSAVFEPTWSERPKRSVRNLHRLVGRYPLPSTDATRSAEYDHASSREKDDLLSQSSDRMRARRGSCESGAPGRSTAFLS